MLELKIIVMFFGYKNIIYVIYNLITYLMFDSCYTLFQVHTVKLTSASL